MVKLDNSRLNRIIRDADTNTENFLKSIGFSIEARAKVKSPVDTSANANSIYTSTRTTDHGLDRSVADSLGRDYYSLPRGTRTKVYVGPTMSYSIYLEFGTSRQPARPYLIPAIEEVSNQLRNHTRLLLP